MQYRLIETPHRTVVVDGPGSAIGSDRDASDLVSAALSDDAEAVAVTVERLDKAFFDLSTGIAGTLAQKCVQYRLFFAVIGDVSKYEEESDSFAGLVLEARRGRGQLAFVADLDELWSRLATMRR